MLDILQLSIHPEEFDQLRICQLQQHSDCHAAFTVRGPRLIWPLASWDEPPVEQRLNVRGWFPVLDKIADEFLIWRPQGGCFFVSRDSVTYRVEEDDVREVLFLQLEMHRMPVVPSRQVERRDAYFGT